MSYLFEREKTQDDIRQEYWVEFYKKVNIEYTPTKDLSYIGLIADVDWGEEGYIINKKSVEYLVSEFLGTTKNTTSYSVACDYWISNCATQGIKCTRDDVVEAYNIAYGYGCEYEFEEL